MISVSDPNPVLVEIILSVSENYPKVHYDVILSIGSNIGKKLISYLMKER